MCRSFFYSCLILLLFVDTALAAQNVIDEKQLEESYLLPVVIILVLLLLGVLIVQKKRIRNFERKVIASHDILEVTLNRAKREVERVRQACELVSVTYFEYDVRNACFIGDSRFFRFFAEEAKSSISLEEILRCLQPEDSVLADCFKLIAGNTGTEEVIDYNGKIHDAQGNLRYMHVYAKAIMDAEGGVLFRRGSMLDITEQKLREIELIRINRQLEFVQRTAGIYSWEISMDEPDRIKISADFYPILGDEYKDVEKVPTSALRGILSDDDYNILITGINMCFLEEKVIDLIVPLYPKNNPEVMYVHVVSFLNSDSSYVDKGIICGVVQNITDLKNAEKKAGHSEKIKALGRLASGVAHDFNNQLSGIMGFAELIRTEQISDVVLDYTNMIIDRGEKSVELVRKLLDFSRNQKEEAELIDVDGLIDDTIRFFIHLVSKSIVVRKDIKVSGLGIFGNYNEIQNALLNLGINSRDSIGENSGEILFEVTTEMLSSDEAGKLQIHSGKYVVISVCDTGHGISQEVMEKVIEPFFTTKPEGEGTGLGLSMVHSVITAMAGGMDINSKVDDGTAVTLYLPLASDNVLYAKANKPRESKIKHGAGRVFIIDDDKSLVKLLTMQLQKAGYEVTGVNDPVEAVKLYEDEYLNFDLVILDMIMPNMNGAEVIRELLAINPDLKSIMMSGYSDEDLFEQARKEGIKYFLTKPVTLTALTKKVAEVLLDDEQESRNEI